MPKGNSRRNLAILAALLVLALAGAYWAGHPDKSRSSRGGQGIALWKLEPSAIKQVVVHLDKSTIRMAPEPGEGEKAAPYLWVTVELPEPPPPPPPEEKPVPPGESAAAKAARESAQAAAKAQREQALAAASAEEGRVLRFKGNRTADTAFEGLRAMLAERRLGALAELNAETFGLANVTDYVEIEAAAGGEPLRINLGGASFGDANRYVHFPRDDGVYLIKQSVLQGLGRMPARMMDRDLFAFPVPQAKQIELRSQDKAVSFWRLAGAEGEEADWGDSPEATQGIEGVPALVKELARLKSSRFVEVEPPKDPPLEIRLSADQQPSAWLRLFKNERGEWLAQSSHTRRAVQIAAPQAQSIADAATALLQSR